jgi:transcriptional regulator GlxA family with amidase domain
MNRREAVGVSLGGAALAVLAAVGSTAIGEAELTAGGLPKRRNIKVAFMLGEGTNVIDTAGPWEVFQDTMVGHHHPFELYTVGPAGKGVLRMTGGLKVQPDYNIENAPQPNVIVVPAQGATDATRAWLKQASAGADITMSVCTGAFQLARVGLLDGLAATTHHDFFDKFAKEFPRVELRRGLRFVDNGRVATAGGLTSGIDMALHVVDRYFGPEQAAQVAAYMEHSSDGWRTKA